MLRKPVSRVRACSCGNPIGPAKCCQRAVNASAWRRGGKVRVGEALKDLQAALNARQFEQFGVIAEKLLARVPGHPMVQYLLGMAHFAHGQLPQARAAMQAGFDQGLNLPEAHLNFANIVGQMGDLTVALQHLRRAASATPLLEKAVEMGLAIAAQLSDSSALAWFAQRACERQPDTESAWVAWVEALRADIQDDRALEIIEQGLKRFPGSRGLRLSQAAILEMQHQLDSAQSLVDALLHEQPESVDVRLLQVRLWRRQHQPERALALLEQLQTEAALEPAQKATLHEEFAHLLRAAGAYAEAWQQGLAMNQAIRKVHPPQGDFAGVDAQLAVIEDMEMPPASAVTHGPLACLVGFPRTGSTLVERLINERFDVLCVSESEAIPTVEQRIGELSGRPWWELAPEDWANLPAAECRALAEQVYQREAGDMRGVVDKNLMNLTRLPLIRWLYPQAKIIRVMRHPLDVLVSCFFAPFSSADAWHTAPDEIAAYQSRIDQHWTRMSEKVPSMEVLCYEAVVQSRGLPAGVLASLQTIFLSRQRPVGNPFFISRTASYERVVQAVDGASLATHKRYPADTLARFESTLRTAVEVWAEQCGGTA